MLAIYKHNGRGRKLLAYLSDNNTVASILAARKIYAFLERCRPDKITVEKMEVEND